MKKEVRKVDKLLPNMENEFNLTKQEAMNMLKIKNITKSEQMLNKWCREGEINAVRISKGDPKNRGLRISEKSLNAFIVKRKGDIKQLSNMLEIKEIEIKELKRKLGIAKSEIKRLKKNYGIQNFFLFTDYAESTFEYHNEQFSALFDVSSNEIIQITKKEKSGLGIIDVTNIFSDREKNEILELRENEIIIYNNLPKN